MEWVHIDWNSTFPEILDGLLDKCSEQSGQLSKFLFDNCVLPVGQYLLTSAEQAVQYTLNGEYEVINLHTLGQPYLRPWFHSDFCRDFLQHFGYKL